MYITRWHDYRTYTLGISDYFSSPKLRQSAYRATSCYYFTKSLRPHFAKTSFLSNNSENIIAPATQPSRIVTIGLYEFWELWIIASNHLLCKLLLRSPGPADFPLQSERLSRRYEERTDSRPHRRPLCSRRAEGGGFYGRTLSWISEYATGYIWFRLVANTDGILGISAVFLMSAVCSGGWIILRWVRFSPPTGVLRGSDYRGVGVAILRESLWHSPLSC